MPQDRVQDFAKQNPQELFRSTQKSVCSDDMIAKFSQLLSLQQEIESGHSTREKNIKNLQDHQQRLEALAHIIEEIRANERLCEKRDVIHKKIAWMDFEIVYLKCLEVKKDLKLATEAHNRRHQQHQELLNETKEFQRKRDELERQYQTKTIERRKCGDEIDKLIDDMEKKKSSIRNETNKLQNIIQNVTEFENDFREAKLCIDTYKSEYEKLLSETESEEEIKRKCDSIDNQVTQVREKINKCVDFRTKINEEIDSKVKPQIVIYEQKMNQIQNEERRRRDLLKSNFPETFQALEWYEENRDLFKSNVYEPMILLLNTTIPEHAIFIESTVNMNDLLAFTCENVDDMNLFIKKTRIERKMDVNVVHSPGGNVRYQAANITYDLRAMGAESYLIDSLDAPAPIVNFMCQNYFIHNVLVGSAELEKHTDQLPKHIQLFFTPQYRVQIKYSKYRTEPSTLSAQLQRKNILKARMTPDEVDQMRQKYDQLIRDQDAKRNKRREIETAITQLEAKCRNLVESKAEIQRKTKNLAEVERKLKYQERKVAQMATERTDVDNEKRLHTEKCKEIAIQIFKIQELVLKVFSKYNELKIDEVASKFCFDKFKGSATDTEIKIMESTQALEEATKYKDRITGLLETYKKECSEKQMAAMKLTNNKKPSDGAHFPFKNKFDRLSNNVDELKSELDVIETQIECQTMPQRESIEEFETRTEQVRLLQAKIASDDSSNETIKHLILKIYENWFEKIEKIISKINQHFSHFMETMDCAGEIELIRKSEHDYQSYGIEIRVKYRNNEKLRALDRLVQSGGERAVAIAVYSLSLQHLSHVPFRCVDEINQGMDASNERRIFDMLVKTVAKKNHSQFFYVTPKLLPNLSYNEHVTCCIVYNGPESQHNDYFIRGKLFAYIDIQINN